MLYYVVQVSHSTLDFGLNGRLCPVLDPQTQTITITNRTDRKIPYEISVVGKDTDTHEIEIYPNSGDIDKRKVRDFVATTVRLLFLYQIH